MKSILGKKVGMTRIFDDNGNIIPVTVIKAGPCKITAIKTKDKDGYSALQLGFDDVSGKNIKKPQRIDFDNKKIKPKKKLKEIRGMMLKKNREGGDKKEEKILGIGDEIKADIFEIGDFVDITGISKGKGFQGGVKRWGWSIGPRTHGSRCYREPGSIGASADPAKVVKGKHMAGRMGGKKTTVKNIEVVKINNGENIISVKGSVPSSNGSYLVIKESYKKKKREIIKHEE